MSWTPDRRYRNDEDCEPLVTRDGNVVFNPLQQSHHLDDEPPADDPVEQTTTTDPLGVTDG